MPAYLMMTFFFLKVTAALESPTEQQHIADWTDTRQSWPSAPAIHKFTGEPSGLRQKWGTPHKQSLFATERFQDLFFLKLCNFWCKTQTDTTISTWKQLMKVPITAWRDYTGNVLGLICYCSEGSLTKEMTERLMVHTRSYLRPFTEK